MLRDVLPSARRELTRTT